VSKMGWIVPNEGTLPLEEWNAARRQHWSDMRARVMHPELFPNGLKCPQCVTGYLYDTLQTLQVSPPVHRVKCISCAFKGERYG
jgi:Zn ribbon nucleic-acid-binding protein